MRIVATHPSEKAVVNAMNALMERFGLHRFNNGAFGIKQLSNHWALLYNSGNLTSGQWSKDEHAIENSFHWFVQGYLAAYDKLINRSPV